MVTIMEVRVSPDLKYANVYFITSVNEKNEEVREALQLAANHFRKIVGAKMELRYVPELNFRIDTSFAEVDKMAVSYTHLTLPKNMLYKKFVFLRLL